MSIYTFTLLDFSEICCSIGWGRAVALNPGGEQHRKYRRLLSKVLNSTAVRKFRPLEQRAAEAFLQDLYKEPGDFMKHIRNSIGNMIVELSYGRETKIGEEGYIDYAEYVHEIFAYAARSFAFMVDMIPMRKSYLFACVCYDVTRKIRFSATCARVDSWCRFPEASSSMAKGVGFDGTGSLRHGEVRYGKFQCRCVIFTAFIV